MTLKSTKAYEAWLRSQLAKLVKPNKYNAVEHKGLETTIIEKK